MEKVNIKYRGLDNGMFSNERFVTVKCINDKIEQFIVNESFVNEEFGTLFVPLIDDSNPDFVSVAIPDGHEMCIRSIPRDLVGD